MTQHSDSSNPFDPFAAFTGMRDTYMDQWSKAMIEFVNSDAYSQATGTMLDNWLMVSAPFRQAVETAMTQTLSQLNMPSRNDVISLAERLTNIEMRLDDLEATMDRMTKIQTALDNLNTKLDAVTAIERRLGDLGAKLDAMQGASEARPTPRTRGAKSKEE